MCKNMTNDGEELMNIIKTRAISDLIGEVREERKRQDEQYNDMVKETIADLSNRIMNLERGEYLSDKFLRR